MSFSDAHDVATEALETFHKIEDSAARLLATRSGEASDALAVINTFTNTAAVAKIASIGDDTTKSLLSLVREPAVSRVVAETDEGEVITYYICRTTNITVKGTMLAGYRTPIGRLAVFDVGESVELEVAGRQRGYRILEKLELKPLKSDDLWDAIDSIWRRRRTTPQTIPSLRKLVQPVDDNAFLAMLGGDSEADKILEGVVHEIRRAMALRDQAILDKIQDEIFRLSIDHQLIILGPPGTGKTTTLIKRLGQKLDVQALSPDEQRLLGPATNRQRWMMFTPSDLLKHYVKEAFNRENVPASDDHIKTWNKRRHDLARSTFGILRTGNSGSCILKEDRRYSSFSVSDDPRQWFADFKSYHQNRLLTSLREGAGLLKDSAPNLSDTVVKELLTTVDELSPEGLLGAYAIWNRIESRIEPLLKTSRGTTESPRIL